MRLAIFLLSLCVLGGLFITGFAYLLFWIVSL